PAEGAPAEPPAASGEARSPEPARHPPRPRNRRRRRLPPGEAAPAREGAERPRAHPAPGERQARGEPSRERGDRGERGPRQDRRGGRPGRGRDGAPRSAERKLYSFDSVVDRGFDDIEEEAETRRVH